MQYSEFVEVYEELSNTTKRLEKISILAEFLKKLKKKGKSEWIYLLLGRVLPDYDSGEIGISTQLTIQAISKASGVGKEDVVKKFRKIGDLGEVAEELVGKKKQSTLFSSRLSVSKVFENLRKLVTIEGKGTVGKKLDLISELLTSASGKEAKYIVRTLLNDLRVGVADSSIREAIAEAFFNDNKKEMAEKIETAYNLSNDFAIVLEGVFKGEKELSKISITPGRPLKVMLAVKVTSMEEAFKVCGKPAALEHKYDGFRMIITKDGGDIKLFTRRLEEVTKQFPDVVEVVKKNIKAKDYILDSEVVGYDSETKLYKPFEAISQRIRRKYDIDKLVKKLPVEVNVFDVLYYNGKGTVKLPFSKRRDIVEKIVKKKKWKIKPAVQIVTDDLKEAEKFYKDALGLGEEGIMVKNIEASYQQGRRVGYMVKMKPEINDLDLVILRAESGTGKRGGLLTSYTLGCKSGDEFLEVGKVSSGLKEKEEEGMTYRAMTKLLGPLIQEEKGRKVKVKPKLIVSVTYQNIQKSPSYNSGYALRFPRITKYRPEKSLNEIATLNEIKKEAKGGRQ